MNAIVCVSKNWGIGRDGRLLFHISSDLRRFRVLTTGRTVILGRKTLLTFPHAKPLPNRRNVVLTRGSLSIDGAETAHSADDALALAGPDAVVIGGSSVYAALLDRCERVYVTKVDSLVEADCFFPDLDADPRWAVEWEGDPLEEDGLRFRYVNYVNLALLSDPSAPAVTPDSPKE